MNYKFDDRIATPKDVSLTRPALHPSPLLAAPPLWSGLVSRQRAGGFKRIGDRGGCGSDRRPLKMGAHDNEFSTAGKIYGELGIDI
jgi:hypothetical protein